MVLFLLGAKRSVFSGCGLSVFYWTFALFRYLGDEKILCFKCRTSIFQYVKYAYEPYGTVLLHHCVQRMRTALAIGFWCLESLQFRAAESDETAQRSNRNCSTSGHDKTQLIKYEHQPPVGSEPKFVIVSCRARFPVYFFQLLRRSLRFARRRSCHRPMAWHSGGTAHNRRAALKPPISNVLIL